MFRNSFKFFEAKFSNNLLQKFRFSTYSSTTCSGDPVGNAKGSFILLDGKTFEPKVNLIFKFYSMSSVHASMQ
jgi:hypothetical protein